MSLTGDLSREQSGEKVIMVYIIKLQHCVAFALYDKYTACHCSGSITTQTLYFKQNNNNDTKKIWNYANPWTLSSVLLKHNSSLPHGLLTITPINRWRPAVRAHVFILHVAINIWFYFFCLCSLPSTIFVWFLFSSVELVISCAFFPVLFVFARCSSLFSSPFPPCFALPYWISICLDYFGFHVSVCD